MSSNETAAIMCPGEPVRFVMSPHGTCPYLLPSSLPSSAKWISEPLAPSRLPEPIRCDVHVYRSRALAWQGLVGCPRGEEYRLQDVLQMAEVAILVFVRIAAVTGMRAAP